MCSRDLIPVFGAARVAAKVQEAARQPFTLTHGHQELNLALSMGVALYPEHGSDFDTLLQAADTAHAGVVGLVYSYVEWVTAQPNWARFVFQSRFAVSSGPFKDELLARNKQRNQQLKEWMGGEGREEHFSHLPAELIPSLIIGAAESYSRAWLSAKVKKSPFEYRELLAEAAWKSISLG